MAANPAPWMPWEPVTWLHDDNVNAMPRAARSMYFDLLNHEWIGGPLPATIPGDAADERELHLRFASHRISGEWFSPDAELLEFIRGLQ
jgi:hypothetical protein